MWYFTKDYESDIRLDGKTVVITGGNNGIGKETSKDLYRRAFWLSRRLDLSEVKNVKHWLFQLEGYSQSKLAQVIFTKELAKRLKDAGIENVTTYSLHPGIIATDIFHNWDIFCWGLAWLWGRFLCRLFFLTPEQGCKTTLYCVLDKELENQSGLYYSNCSQDTTNRLVNNSNLAKELWEKSLEFTNLVNYNPFKPEETQ